MSGTRIHLGSRNLLFVLLAICSALLSFQGWSAGEYCNDWERENLPKAAQIKAQIKASARAEGVPERLLHLYDALPDCEMCLEDISPTPFITIHYQTGGPKMVDWDADMEFEARHGLRAGYIKAFYIHVEASQCVCCTATNEEEYEDWQPFPDDVAPSPGWVDELDLDISLSDAYTDPDQLGEDPSDLTEIDASDAYPDLIEPPLLVMPPPIRPLNTLCSQCQPAVDAHNDHLKTIRAKQREIAQLVRHRGVTRKAIAYRIRAIYAHSRKAQVGDWEEVLDEMNNHRYDLEATERQYNAEIKQAEAELAELLDALEALRQNIHECEERCRLDDSQALPTLTPQPISYAEDAPLPPYIRIASQACNECRGTMDTRNDLARQMNSIVVDILANGYTQERLDTWNALQTKFESANALLRECLDTCGQSEPNEPVPPSSEDPENDPSPDTVASPAPPSVDNKPGPLTAEEATERWRDEFNRCEPCNKYWHQYRAALDELTPLYEQIEELQFKEWALSNSIRRIMSRIDYFQGALRFDLSVTYKKAYNSEVRSLKRDLRDAEAELKLVKTRIRRLWEAVRAVELRAMQIKVEWRHCVATQCRLSTELPREIRPDQMGYPEQQPIDELTMLFFVSTTCEPCSEEARDTNDWLLEQYRSWLTEYMAEHHGQPGRFAGSPFSDPKFIPEGKWEGFWTLYQRRIAALRKCEKQCALEDEPASWQEKIVYQSPNIGSGRCTSDLKDELFGDNADDSQDSDLPPSCRGEPVFDWYESDCSSGQNENEQEASPPPSCDLQPEFDWYEGECDGNSGCDSDTEQTQTPGNACEYEGRIENGRWWNPGGCSGAPRSSQAWKITQPTDPAVTSVDTIRKDLQDSWGLRQIKLYTQQGDNPPPKVEPVVVAVIDSGIDYQHPDLLGMIWKNADEIAGNGIDDDNNGYVDDVRGWNFIANSPAAEDFNGHGTLVAGIIAATPNNEAGIAGVNPWARIMPLKVTNYLGRGYSSDIASAIVYAVSNGASVINISLGGSRFSPAEEQAVSYALNKNVLVVAAAGNLSIDTANFWPAGLKGVMTVAALDTDGTRAAYSNWGEAIDIAAPGTDILSLRARSTDLVFFVDEKYEQGSKIVGTDNLLYYVTGTSFAAPYVSGAGSLILALQPELSARQVRNMLEQNADDIENPGTDPLTGFGSLNVAKTLSSSPEYFVTADITGISALQKDGVTYLQVSGSADASELVGISVSIGEGETPSSWQLVAESRNAVDQGQLALVPAERFARNTRWQIKLETRHANGRVRVSVRDLTLQ